MVFPRMCACKACHRALETVHWDTTGRARVSAMGTNHSALYMVLNVSAMGPEPLVLVLNGSMIDFACDIFDAFLVPTGLFLLHT